MKTSFNATVVNGGLKLDEPLDLSENSQVRVTVVPVPPDNGKRDFGKYRGKIKIAADFDAPLPDDFWFGGQVGNYLSIGTPSCGSWNRRRNCRIGRPTSVLIQRIHCT